MMENNSKTFTKYQLKQSFSTIIWYYGQVLELLDETTVLTVEQNNLLQELCTKGLEYSLVIQSSWFIFSEKDKDNDNLILQKKVEGDLKKVQRFFYEISNELKTEEIE